MSRQLYITSCHERPFRFVPPPVYEDYALLLVVAANDVTPEEQTSISRQIIASRARYVAAWGHECSTWDSSVDCAFLETDPNFTPPDEKFVMTTWHEKESLDGAFEFLWLCGIIDDGYPDTVCVFILGGDLRTEFQVRRAAVNLNISGIK